jgi:vacuolar-type H+-ATPase subunit E/Vma4
MTICRYCKNEHTETTKTCAPCKEKAKIAAVARYSKKKEEIREKAKERYAANPEPQKAQSKKQYEENREDILEKAKERYEENREEILEKKKERYEENREEILEKDKERYNMCQRRLKCIKDCAKRRNLIVELTDDQIMNMTDEDCVYCGEKTVDGVSRNGIDRMNNSIGYTVDNSVPCCSMCNLMKVCLDSLTFVVRCEQISFVHGGPGETTDAWLDNALLKYEYYKSAQNRKVLHFELTEGEYYDLRARACHYCARKTSSTHHNGIDRTDSSIGYTIENCVSCCGGCNIAKKTLKSEVFIEQCKRIASYEHAFPDMPRCLNIWGKI